MQLQISPAVLLTLTLFSIFSRPIFAAPLGGSNILVHRDISQGLFDELVLYTRWSQAARPDSCQSPLGNTLVAQIHDTLTDTQGIVARDDSRKEIIVSFRGSEHPIDFVVDAVFPLVSLSPSSIPSSSASTLERAEVHVGFLTAFNSVASTVVGAVRSELSTHTDYTISTVGHSLGGALASIASVVLKANFPTVPMRVYTFGQPRTGNEGYANLVESMIGAGNIYRVVHTSDIVPRIPSQDFGFRHHGTEFWQSEDPASPETIIQCSGQEDPSCSEGSPISLFRGIEAHRIYLGRRLSEVDSSICQ